MGLFSLFITRKPRSFNYQPIYWDKNKEERNERFKQNEPDTATGDYKPSITRGSFRKNMNKGDIDKRFNAIKKQHLRMFAFLIILILVLLFFLAYGDNIISLYFDNGL